MGAKIWNSIPENLRNSSKSLFKEKVHTILLKIFEVQDRYADLNTIISDLKKTLATACLNCDVFILNTVLFFTSIICNKSCAVYTPPASISLAICRWCDICIFNIRNKDVVVVSDKGILFYKVV